MDNDKLIAHAAEKLNVHTTDDGYLCADVAAALISGRGHLFTGVCVGTPSWGLCAERSAIAAMITSGEYTLSKIVAVWRKPETGRLYVLPPCGHCREFMRNVSPKNLNTEVILGRDRTALLSDLLPEHAWPKPLDS